jgi:hypothetical protein
LYALFDYAPAAARHFDSWADPHQWHYLKVLGQVFISVSTQTMTFAPLVATLGLSRIGPRLRQALVLLAATLCLSAFFSSRSALLLAGTLFGKMDFGHFSWTVALMGWLACAFGWQELAEAPAQIASYRRLLGLSLGLLAALAAGGMVAGKTLTLNLFAGAALWLALDPAAGDSLPARIGNRFMAASLATLGGIAGLGALLLLRSRVNPYLVLILAFYLWGSWRLGRELSGPSRCRACLLILLASLFVGSVRWFRHDGPEPERYPYKTTLEDFSFLQRLRGPGGPWRSGAVGGFEPYVLANYSLETPTVRSPIVNRRFKEFFKLIVRKQLVYKKDERFFDWYWYHLLLMNGDESLRFSFPLLALANVRYLISAVKSPGLAEAAESVHVEMRDSSRFAERVSKRLTAFLPERIQEKIQDKLRRQKYYEEYYVYTLRDTFPRGFLAQRASVLPSDEAVLGALALGTTEQLRTTAYFAESDLPRKEAAAWTKASVGGDCRLLDYSPDRLEYEVSLPRPAILVVTNNFHRHWRATIDGAAAAVRRADHAFQAVPLPQAGEHRVVLVFHDPYLAVMHLGLPLGLLLMLLPVLWPRRRGPAVPGVSQP